MILTWEPVEEIDGEIPNGVVSVKIDGKYQLCILKYSEYILQPHHLTSVKVAPKKNWNECSGGCGAKLLYGLICLHCNLKGKEDARTTRKTD